MNEQDRERLVRVEEGIKHLTGLLTECKLPDMRSDISSLKQTQRNVRRFGWTTVSTTIVAAVTYFLKDTFHVG